MRLLFNILAITGLAMFAGVMLTIGVILGGYWKSLPASEFLEWFGQNNRFIMQAIPLVVVPTFLGQAGSLWLGWSDGVTRALWLGAILCTAAVLALTIIWFDPNNAQFATKSIPLDQGAVRLDTWLMVHDGRLALATVESVLGILAIN
jgi:hypothetical protein